MGTAGCHVYVHYRGGTSFSTFFPYTNPYIIRAPTSTSTYTIGAVRPTYTIGAVRLPRIQPILGAYAYSYIIGASHLPTSLGAYTPNVYYRAQLSSRPTYIIGALSSCPPGPYTPIVHYRGHANVTRVPPWKSKEPTCKTKADPRARALASIGRICSWPNFHTIQILIILIIIGHSIDTPSTLHRHPALLINIYVCRNLRCFRARKTPLRLGEGKFHLS